MTAGDAAADDARFRALIGALRRTVTDPAAEGALRDDARGWLSAQGLEDDDVAALLRYSPRRLAVYRTLVHRGLAASARVQMPRTVRRLGARFEGEVARFCALSLPRSHYLRDAPREMVESLAPGWSADPALPAFLGDLARHELSLYEVGAAPPRPGSVDPEALDLARPVGFDGAARMLRYAYPVHRLGDEGDSLGDEGDSLGGESASLGEEGDSLEPQPTQLFAYRDGAHEVRYLELTSFGAALVERLLAGDPLGGAVQGACAACSVPLDATWLGRASALLADLAARGALLGAHR